MTEERGGGSVESVMSISVVGVVRDAEKNLQTNIDSLERFLSDYDLSWVIVESNSRDHTVQILEKNRVYKSSFYYYSLAPSPESSRIASIAKARQYALERIRQLDIAPTLILVIDLDQNYDWDRVKLKFPTGDVDAVFAHQIPYYDLFAFRPMNAWVKSKYYNYRHRGDIFGKVLNQILFVPWWQLKLGRIENPLKVESAFGGAAIYKYRTYVNGNYLKNSYTEGSNMCEHVAFHRSIKKANKQMFIDPGFKLPVKNQHTVVANAVLRLMKLVR